MREQEWNNPPGSRGQFFVRSAELRETGANSGIVDHHGKQESTFAQSMSPLSGKWLCLSCRFRWSILIFVKRRQIYQKDIDINLLS